MLNEILTFPSHMGIVNGRIPGFKRLKLNYLVGSIQCFKVFNTYQSSCQCHKLWTTCKWFFWKYPLSNEESRFNWISEVVLSISSVTMSSNTGHTVIHPQYNAVFIAAMIIQKYSHRLNFESTKSFRRFSRVGLARSDLTTLQLLEDLFIHSGIGS